MSKTKLLIGLISAVLFAAGFGSAVIPAAAAEHTYVVTTASGKTYTVSGPAGASYSQLKSLGGIDGEVVSARDITPTEVVTTTTVVTTTPDETTTTEPTTTSKTTTTTKTTPNKPTQPKHHRKPTTVKPKKHAKTQAEVVPEAVTTTPGGAPTPTDPSFSLALPGPAAVGVPNFFIDKFRIPPFLLPIYQAAGVQYGIKWEVLAAINEIETDYGRNLSVSSAGALGWMQFMPDTWKTYGVDANRDGKKDPYNPVDAIFAAARYLKAAGGDTDIRKAIFSYNHADWYVDSVILRAKLISGLPADLVGSLTGLTQGHFPVHAKASYADDLSAADAKAKAKDSGNASVADDSNPNRRTIDIFAKKGSPAIASQDGTIVGIGTDPKGGRFIKLRDGFGNTYTYGGLASLSAKYPVAKDAPTPSDKSVRKELGLDKADPKPDVPATAGAQRKASTKAATTTAPDPAADTTATDPAANATDDAAASGKERLFAHPTRPRAYRNGGADQVAGKGDDSTGSTPGVTTFKSYFTGIYGLNTKDVELKPLKVGSKVIAGTILGKLGVVTKGQDPHVAFTIRPAGRGAPRIDPKPILDGWKLLESTAIYRAAGKNALLTGSGSLSVGQILLMSKDQLTQTVLKDPRIQIYACGRKDIESGIIDRRVLATLAFLSASGLRPTVTALECGHGEFTSSGNVSEHSTGDAVDIGAINGITIEPSTQGPGTITDITIRRLLTLQGSMKPHQIISLMQYPGADNTLALPDHYDHIHVGFHPDTDTGSGSLAQSATLKPSQWKRLLNRLSSIANPTVPTSPSKYAIPDDK
jgi:outer membrane biosynthesis protein TonB